MALLDDDAFKAYKTRMVPVLYDWFMHYYLSYPTQTCRWGPKVEELGYKTRYRAYLSEQVVDESRPNTLILANIDVYKPHIASCEAVTNWQEKSTSPHVNIVKTVYHPGEVNKVRELPQQPNVVVTHTDSRKLFVWNMDRQPDRRPQSSGLAAAVAAAKTRTKGEKQGSGGGAAPSSAPTTPASASGSGSSAPSVPDLTLAGHEDDAQFPLACASGPDPRVASGGNDTLVLCWDLADYVTSLSAAGAGEGPSGRKAPDLKPRTRLQGHTATVGDLVFQPGCAAVLCSVADDGRILTWDVRAAAGGPVSAVEAAHGAGVNVMCVDWCPLDEHMLVTGAQDGSLQVWDRRRMSCRADRLHCFDAHRNSTARDIIHVEWHPTAKDVFASGAEDHTIAIWDLTCRHQPPPEKAAAGAAGADAGGPSTSGAGGSGEAEKAAAGGGRKRTRSAKDGAGGGKGGAPAANVVDLPDACVFQHLGHRLGRVTDFQWLPSEPWTIISVSDNTGVTDDGTLQVWRLNDLIYRPFEEAMAELEQHRQFILNGGAPSSPSSAGRAREGGKEAEQAQAAKPEEAKQEGSKQEQEAKQEPKPEAKDVTMAEAQQQGPAA